MNRFASLITTAAIAGSLFAAAATAQAASALYLVPISDLNATYAPGASVQFAALVDIGIGSFTSVTVQTAVAYTSSQFGSAKPTARYDATPDANNPGSPFWSLNTLPFYNPTASVMGGSTVLAFQPVSSHTAVKDKSGQRIAIPTGTYTVATFTFPISPTIAGNAATVYLPTPFGFTNSALSADGAYQTGVGPMLKIAGKDSQNVTLYDSLAFPNGDGKYSSLSFKVAASVPEPGSVALLFSLASVGIGVLRKRRNR